MRCLTGFISSHFYWIKLKFYNHNWNIYISSKRRNYTSCMTRDRQTQLWGSADVLQDKAEHFQLMRHREHWWHVGLGLSTDLLLTLTDTQTKSHQDIEDHCLQEEHTKSCDHQRHHVHQRVCGQQHWKDWLSWRRVAAHLEQSELYEPGCRASSQRTVPSLSSETHVNYCYLQNSRDWFCSYKLFVRTFRTVGFPICLLVHEGHLVKERVLRDQNWFRLIEQCLVLKLAESAEPCGQTCAGVSMFQLVKGRLVLVPWRPQKHNRT